MKQLLRLLGHQSWIRLGIRKRIIDHFYNPDKISKYPFTVNYFGLKYQGNLNNRLDWYLFFFGSFEGEYLSLLQNIANRKPSPIFLDIGANVGQYSLFMSTICKQVHSFEPYSLVRRSFNENIAFNNIKNIHVYDVGLGSNDENLCYYPPQGSNQGTGSFVQGFSDNNCTKPIKLTIKNGDQYIEDLNLDHLDVIKIDVEGFEKSVLIGLKHTLEQYRPYVTMEYSAETMSSFENREELLALLPKKYTIRKITYDSPKLLFFNRSEYRLTEYSFSETGCDLLLYPEE